MGEQTLQVGFRRDSDTIYSNATYDFSDESEYLPTYPKLKPKTFMRKHILHFLIGVALTLSTSSLALQVTSFQFQSYQNESTDTDNANYICRCQQNLSVINKYGIEELRDDLGIVIKKLALAQKSNEKFVSTFRKLAIALMKKEIGKIVNRTIQAHIPSMQPGNETLIFESELSLLTYNLTKIELLVRNATQQVEQLSNYSQNNELSQDFIQQYINNYTANVFNETVQGVIYSIQASEKSINESLIQYAKSVDVFNIKHDLLGRIENANQKYQRDLRSKLSDITDRVEANFSQLDAKCSEQKADILRNRNELDSGQIALARLQNAKTTMQSDLRELSNDLSGVKVRLARVEYLGSEMKSKTAMLSNNTNFIRKNTRGWLVAGNGYMYRIYPTPTRSWYNADVRCGSIGGRLAYIGVRDKPIHDWLFSNFIKLYNHMMWIGMTDTDDERHWKWLDKSPVTRSWSNWAPNQPNDYGSGQDCAVWDKDSLWNDVECNIPVGRENVFPLCEQEI